MTKILTVHQISPISRLMGIDQSTDEVLRAEPAEEDYDMDTLNDVATTIGPFAVDLYDNQLENVGGEDSVVGEDTKGGKGNLGGEETVSVTKGYPIKSDENYKIRVLAICGEGCTQLKALFWQASKSTTPEEFETVMEEIKKVYKEACKHLRTHNPKLWSKAFFFTHSKCDAVENNMYETFNGSIIKVRHKLIIGMLEDIRVAVMVRMQKRKDLMMKWDGSTYPKIKDKLEANKEHHRY
ncbi:hypothetical protein LguiA_017948 [Lonicera macranthoides]